MTIESTATANSRVDLYVERRQERRAVYLRSRRDAAVLASLALAWGCALAPLTATMARQRRLLSSETAQSASAQKRRRAVATAASGADERLARLAQVTEVRSRRRAWAATVAEMAALSSSDICLDSARFEARDGETEMRIEGSAMSIMAANSFIARLSRSPRFTRVGLTDTSPDVAFGRGSVHFVASGKLGCELGGGAALEE
jgi:hypothetical protein